jgi:hypothetical protein
MPAVFKIKGKNVLVVQLTHQPDSYGRNLFKVIKRNGMTVQGNERVQLGVNDIEDPRRAAPPHPPTSPHGRDPLSCPECGTHNRMGYVQSVSCPNCGYTESFKTWLGM